MRSFVIVILLSLSGCAAAGKVQNEGTLGQQMKQDTQSSLKQQEQLKGPTPNNTTVNARAEKGATQNVYVITPTPTTATDYKETDASVNDKTSAKSKAKWSVTEVDGFYYLLIAFSVVLIAFAYVAVANTTKAGKSVDTIVGLAGEELERLTIGSEGWNAVDRLKKEAQWHLPKVKSLWPW